MLFCKHDSHWSQPIPSTQEVHGSIPLHEFFKTKLNFRLTSKGDEATRAKGYCCLGGQFTAVQPLVYLVPKPGSNRTRR